MLPFCALWPSTGPEIFEKDVKLQRQNGRSFCSISSLFKKKPEAFTTEFTEGTETNGGDGGDGKWRRGRSRNICHAL
jgi:hypothetical protein